MYSRRDHFLETETLDDTIFFEYDSCMRTYFWIFREQKNEKTLFFKVLSKNIIKLIKFIVMWRD